MYLEKLSMKGKTAVITGGTQGIGYACAQALGEAGARLIILTDDSQQIPAAQAGLREEGYVVDAFQADVTDSAAINALVEKIERDIAAVDTLVCNAGISPAFIGAEDVEDDLFLRVMDVNLNGVFWSCRAFGRKMLSRQRGTIVNIGSMSGVICNIPQDQSYYNVSKAAVHHLTRNLAAEWAAEGVRVNCVAPTFIETALTRFGMEDNPDMAKVWLEMTPMKRVGQPDEIASVVLFLASDASSLMTGSVVLADAGYTLW